MLDRDRGIALYAHPGSLIYSIGRKADLCFFAMLGGQITDEGATELL